MCYKLVIKSVKECCKTLFSTTLQLCSAGIHPFNKGRCALIWLRLLKLKSPLQFGQALPKFLVYQVTKVPPPMVVFEKSRDKGPRYISQDIRS